MKDRSTLTPAEYIFECAAWCLPVLVLYNNLLFRCIGSLSYKGSRRLLLIMIVSAALICGFILYRNSRTGWTVALSMVLPVGLYSAVSYRHILGIYFAVTVGIAAGVSLIYGFLLMGRMGKRRRKGLIIRRRLCRWFAGTAYIFGIAMFILLAKLTIQSIFCGAVLRPSVSAVSCGSEIDEDEYTENMEMMLKLQGDEWTTLSPRERLNVLQSAVNVETVYFGLPHEINVEVVNKENIDQASYSDATHTIYISVDDIESGTSSELLEACCREVYHGYQYRIVETYLNEDKTTRKLRCFNNAAEYAKEFECFVYDTGSICEYYGPRCEKDAQEYAESAVSYYAHLFGTYVIEAETVSCDAVIHHMGSPTLNYKYNMMSEFGAGCYFKRSDKCYPSPVLHAVTFSKDESEEVTLPVSKTLTKEKSAQMSEELNIPKKAQSLAVRIVELKKQKRGLDNSIRKVEKELEWLFDEREGG